MTADLCKKLRSREVLHRSWAVVRQSGLASLSEDTVKAIKRYDENWVSNLERISKQLRSDTFRFNGERGITIDKGKGKPPRPLVIAPIDNRIVRRAILEVLQGFGTEQSRPSKKWLGIPAIKLVMATRTSVGGIKERSVAHGLSLIDEAVRDGKTSFVRSDIRNFFTRIPLAQVNEFIAGAVADERFAELVGSALKSSLTNTAELQERDYFKLFPQEDIGVAQGSALSALAANIALRDFDDCMNDRGIVCVRYIDDFIMLGRTRSSVLAAYSSGRALLADMGMSVYDGADGDARRAGKYDEGNIYAGTDVLGYRVSGTSRQPSSAAQRAFKAKCEQLICEAKKDMRLAATGQPWSGRGYHQHLVLLHKTIRGWSQAFRHTTATHVFKALDAHIDDRIEELRRFAFDLTRDATNDVRRRVMGVQLLGDTPPHPLPQIPPAVPSLGGAVGGNQQLKKPPRMQGSAGTMGASLSVGDTMGAEMGATASVAR